MLAGNVKFVWGEYTLKSVKVLTKYVYSRAVSKVKISLYKIM